jgi:hypothetical protein
MRASASEGEVVSAGEADLLGGERKLKPAGVHSKSSPDMHFGVFFFASE